MSHIFTQDYFFSFSFNFKAQISSSQKAQPSFGAGHFFQCAIITKTTPSHTQKTFHISEEKKIRFKNPGFSLLTFLTFWSKDSK